MLAVHLRQRWNHRVWDRVAELLRDLDVSAPAPQPVSQARVPKQRQRRLRPEQIDQLVIDYQNGLSVAATAREYRVDVKTARAHLLRRGIAIRQSTVTIPSSKLAELRALKTSGMNNVQIAKHFGCSRQAVQQALRR